MTKRTKPRKLARKASRSGPCARCAELEKSVREWQERTSGASEFWRGQMDEMVARHNMEMKVKRAQLRRARAELDDVKREASLSRRQGGPSAVQVYREYKARRPSFDTESATEDAVARAFQVTPRTIRRRLLEFRDTVKRSMLPLHLEEEADRVVLVPQHPQKSDR